MTFQREGFWKKRLYDVDFTIIRAQMARAQGVPITHISEAAVQRRVEALHVKDAQAYERAYPRASRSQRAVFHPSGGLALHPFLIIHFP